MIPYLWFDAESTGLEYTKKDTVLEVAWLVTDENLRQVTPLRSRMTLLPPHGDAPHVSRTPVPGSDGWADMRANDVVKAMHTESKLADDWATFREREPALMITHGAELERLVLDDLTAACSPFVLERGQARLAGAGVSHFDQGLLAYHCPRLGPRDRPPGMLHYRCADTSVTAEVLGVEADLSFLEAFASSEDLKVDAPGHHWPTNGLEVDFEALRDRAHRAGTDVLVALATARTMRGMRADVGPGYREVPVSIISPTDD